jgi:hypothetical protein
MTIFRAQITELENERPLYQLSMTRAPYLHGANSILKAPKETLVARLREAGVTDDEIKRLVEDKLFVDVTLSEEGAVSLGARPSQ